jgi:hypothetical protein
LTFNAGWLPAGTIAGRNNHRRQYMNADQKLQVAVNFEARSIEYAEKGDTEKANHFKEKAEAKLQEAMATAE